MSYGFSVENVLGIQDESAFGAVLFLLANPLVNLLSFFQLLYQLISISVLFFFGFFLFLHLYGISGLFFFPVEVLLHSGGSVVYFNEENTSHTRSSHHQQHQRIRG